ncbi:MAG: hypothetical protein WC139_03025 [Candidatus Kapaibacterium sp.]
MTKIYKMFLSVCIFFLAASMLPAQGKYVPFNLSLVYPVSINRSIKDDVGFNLGIIGSRFNKLNGASINGMYSILESDLNGFQVNGLYAETRGKLRGFQVSGGANVLTNGGRGLLFGGLANLSFDDFQGLQFAGIANVNFENLNGVQLAGIYNSNGKDISLLQSALAANVTGKKLYGAQLAFLFNVAGYSNHGLQLSSLNITKSQKGVQIGLVNAVNDNYGLQIGIINAVTKKQKGTTLGLVYIYNNTKTNILLSAGNLSYATFGARFRTNNIYTMFDMGGPVVSSSTTKSFLVSYRAGYTFKLKHFDINTDLGYSHISNENDQVPNKKSSHQFAVTFRTGLEKNVYKKLGVFINGGYTFLADSYYSPHFTNKFIIEGGVVLL